MLNYASPAGFHFKDRERGSRQKKKTEEDEEGFGGGSRVSHCEPSKSMLCQLVMKSWFS